MTNSTMCFRVAATLGIAATMAACSDTVGVKLSPVVNPLFTSYVALGNSITAGYQSGGINDSTQQQSYAVMLAEQMGTRFAYPKLAGHGCPPPLTEFGSPVRVGGDTASNQCSARDAATATYALNNVAVPGATSFDPFSQSTSSSNALTMFILGGKTQAQRALEAQPTFASIWIGNNDVLAAAVSGMLTATPGISPGLTPLPEFETNYDSLISVLTTSPTLRGGVLIGVVNASFAPILFPATMLYVGPFKAGLDAAAGTTITIDASCLGSSSLISLQVISAIRGGTHPAQIVCTKGLYPAPLGDVFVLDAAEQTTVNNLVTAYNQHLESIADDLGWAYWDPNPALQTLKGAGCIAQYPNLASATETFGPCMSLDGVHPSVRAHREVTNALVNVINTQYGTSLQPVATP